MMVFPVSASTAPPMALTSVPLAAALADGTRVVLDRCTPGDVDAVMAILNAVIVEGTTYPIEAVLTRDEFVAYFMSHDNFTLKVEATGEVVGSFHVKPNFPGRCSHVCNGGFVVAEAFRGKGAGRVMGAAYLPIAAELGYRMSMFNLVYVTNTASVRLWDSLGFTRLATVPKVGRLKGLGYVDAIQFIYDLTTVATFPGEKP